MKKKISLTLVAAILALAAFLRLYRISDYMTFLGDEGRDVLVAKGILEGHFTLLGPRASAGDFFLGPFYYYMVTPFLWLWRFDPVGPAVMVALLSVATVFLVYYTGRKFFNETAGIFASALYAVSPLVITYAHSSWNPDVLPFFSLVTILMLYKSVSKKTRWLYSFMVGILLGIDLQLHYLSLFLGVIVFLYIFFGDWLLNKKIILKRIFANYFFTFLGFLVGFSPFIAFEIRHNFPNTKTIFSFIFGETLVKPYQIPNTTFTSSISDVFFRIFGRLVFRYPTSEQAHLFSSFDLQLWGSLVLLISFAAIIKVFFMKNRQAALLLLIWLFTSILLFGLYKKPIYDYYFVFIFTLPFLLIGNLFSGFGEKLKDKKLRKSGYVIGFALFISLFCFNLYDNQFRYSANRQKDQARTIAEFVLSKSLSKPFNFALISKGNSDHAYRYFFEIMNHPPVTIENSAVDPDRRSVTDQLLIVCEDIECKPLGNSLWEIAGFGRAEIEGEWNVSVVKVFKLVHYKEDPGQ